MMQSLSGCRILVIEDEPLLAMELVEHLDFVGASVIGPIGSVEQALAVLRTECIHAAVLDVQLGREYVWPLAYALLARRIPFLFATGMSLEKYFPMDLRRVHRLEKPYAPCDVANALRHLVPSERERCA